MDLREGFPLQQSMAFATSTCQGRQEAERFRMIFADEHAIDLSVNVFFLSITRPAFFQTYQTVR
jgi:hypothetical protein